LYSASWAQPTTTNAADRTYCRATTMRDEVYCTVANEDGIATRCRYEPRYTGCTYATRVRYSWRNGDYLLYPLSSSAASTRPGTVRGLPAATPGLHIHFDCTGPKGRIWECEYSRRGDRSELRPDRR
jgi:hypothetical protein